MAPLPPPSPAAQKRPRSYVSLTTEGCRKSSAVAPQPSRPAAGEQVATFEAGDMALVAAGERSGLAGTVTSCVGALVTIALDDGRRLVEKIADCRRLGAGRAPARPGPSPA